jgi:hypothetical protein
VLSAISRALSTSSSAVSDRAFTFGTYEPSPKIFNPRNSVIHFFGVRNLSSGIGESEEPFTDQYSDIESLEESSSDADTDSGSMKESKMPLFKVVVGVPQKESVGDVLDKWISSGNTLVRKDVYSTLSVLKSRRLYAKASEVYNLFQFELHSFIPFFCCRINANTIITPNYKDKSLSNNINMYCTV